MHDDSNVLCFWEINGITVQVFIEKEWAIEARPLLVCIINCLYMHVRVTVVCLCVCVCVCLSVCLDEINFYVRLHQPGIVPTVYI